MRSELVENYHPSHANRNAMLDPGERNEYFSVGLIARRLAGLPRWNAGLLAAKSAHSIAHHSVVASLLVPPPFRLAALFHWVPVDTSVVRDCGLPEPIVPVDVDTECRPLLHALFGLSTSEAIQRIVIAASERVKARLWLQHVGTASLPSHLVHCTPCRLLPDKDPATAAIEFVSRARMLLAERAGWDYGWQPARSARISFPPQDVCQQAIGRSST